MPVLENVASFAPEATNISEIASSDLLGRRLQLGRPEGNTRPLAEENAGEGILRAETPPRSRRWA